MVRFVGVALLAASLAGGGSASAVHGYGMSIRIPSGWHTRITHGLVRVRGSGLRFELRESSPMGRPDPFFRRHRVPTLRASDFVSGEHHLGFTLSGRRFALLPFPVRRAAQPSAIGAANSVLRSFEVKPGNYYGQRLLPARFPPRAGWFAAARGGTLLAEGGQTETWAATLPYRDPPLQIPPHRTLSRLPVDGVIIWVSLSRDSALRAQTTNSFRIRRPLISSSFEGLPRGVGLYRATVRRRAYDVSLWVFFKTVHPAASVIANAQRELDSLQFPRWPAG